MTPESEANLLEFCVLQKARFRYDDWLTFPHPDKDEMAAVCLFLAGVDWYVRRIDLREIAGRLRPGSPISFEKLMRLTRFDAARFSNRLRRAMSRAATAS